MDEDLQVKHVVREETLFAGIRKPLKKRDELIPRMQAVTEACGDQAVGPLVHILRFDTPVEGFDSEIGFPVTAVVEKDEVYTHTLRKLHFFSLLHKGPVDTLRNTTLKILEHMKKAGLSTELELVEIYHRFDLENQADNLIEVRVAFLAWPEVYLEQLLRVLGPELTAKIWQGGEMITPYTLVDERVAWVAQSIERLKQHTNLEQQFDVLSRVALVRPAEDAIRYKQIYAETGDANQILAMQNEELKASNGGFIDPPWYKDGILHLSKVAYNRAGYDAATTLDELRKAYCFCALIREAQAPEVDPIFCYRAAGWARQFWEPILGVEFKQCTITHSILKGDRFCAWDYEVPGS
jgi:effector-binding domain-containing protein